MDFQRNFRLKTYGPEMINRLSKPILEEDFEDLLRLKTYMVEVMNRSNGVGLAAPQIGLFKNFIVFEKRGEIIDLINPEITRLYGKEVEDTEGCLSLPPFGNECRVPRMEKIEVEASTIEDPYKTQTFRFTRLSARIVQHEVDHLFGTFFIDRVPDKQRRLVLERFDGWKARQRAQTRFSRGGTNVVTRSVTAISS